MLDGLYFQFPKLGFILFFFLACEALCPLRSNAFYFPRVAIFGAIGVKSPLWLWIAKWGMICFFIVALMSPVKDKELVNQPQGWDILVILDPKLIDPETQTMVASVIDQRKDERIALWIPDHTIVPLTHDHEALKSILLQTPKGESSIRVNREISHFFATSEEGLRIALILSDQPKSFIYALPVGIQTTIISPKKDSNWIAKLNRDYPPYHIETTRRYFDYYYIYPLFLGFLSMLAYLYGRNQKGLK